MPNKVRSTTSSLLGVLLFNRYPNDIFHSIDADLSNFADDNDLSSVGHTMGEAKALHLSMKQMPLQL